MNQSDREALRAFSDQLTEVTTGLKALQTLGKKETVDALEGLVRVAPTLVKLAEGYNAAGTVGGWFGKIIKWIASLAGLVLALTAVMSLYFGDSK
jgi:hypothetical protein